MVDAVMFSSASTEWGTPQWLFDQLDEEFQFNLDPAATDENAKCRIHFTKTKGDGLKQMWVSVGEDDRGNTMFVPGRVFCNPPYGKAEKACPADHSQCVKKKCVKRGYHIDEDVPGVGDWVRKAHEQFVEGKAELVVMLLPARTDTDWFHEYIYQKPNVTIRFLRGRVAFEGGEHTSTFPSMVVVWQKVPTASLFGRWLSG